MFKKFENLWFRKHRDPCAPEFNPCINNGKCYPLDNTTMDVDLVAKSFMFSKKNVNDFNFLLHLKVCDCPDFTTGDFCEVILHLKL